MIKMVVCDIDGTIFDGKVITKNLIEAVDRIRKDGIKFVIATGRTYQGAKPIIAPLNIDTPIICYQGSTIFSPQGEVLYEKGLERDFALNILDYLKAQKYTPNIYISDKLYCEKETRHIKEYSLFQKIDYSVEEDIRQKDFKSMNKMLVIDDDTNKIDELVKDLCSRYGDKIYARKSTPTYCEICASGVSKGAAVLRVAAEYGIKKEEIMGCGDQNNDIELMTETGIGVAMGNATDELKSYANFITDTVQNDGVVKAINKFVYGEEYARI
jgi:hypothetical protein